MDDDGDCVEIGGGGGEMMSRFGGLKHSPGGQRLDPEKPSAQHYFVMHVASENVNENSIQ